MLDEILLERPASQGLLDVELDELSDPKGAHRNVAVSDKHSLGVGCGTDGARIKHPVKHMEGFRMFLLLAKKPRQIDLSDINEKPLLRYVQVEEHIFCGRKPSVASDGVRVSGNDAVYLNMGWCHLEVFRAVWGVVSHRYCTKVSQSRHRN